MGEVVCDTAGVAYTEPGGTVHRVEWLELRVVELVTTDGGPFTEDVFWVLHGTGSPLVVPQSAGGSDDLLARLQQLPGFDSKAVIAAMSSTSAARFLCWDALMANRLY